MRLVRWFNGWFNGGVSENNHSNDIIRGGILKFWVDGGVSIDGVGVDCDIFAVMFRGKQEATERKIDPSDIIDIVYYNQTVGVLDCVKLKSESIDIMNGVITSINGTNEVININLDGLADWSVCKEIWVVVKLYEHTGLVNKLSDVRDMLFSVVHTDKTESKYSIIYNSKHELVSNTDWQVLCKLNRSEGSTNGWEISFDTANLSHHMISAVGVR